MKVKDGLKHLKMNMNDRYKKYRNSKKSGMKAMRKKKDEFSKLKQKLEL